MTSPLIYYCKQMAEEFLEVKAKALQTWRSSCDCSDPGKHDDCLQCPAFRALTRQIQGLLTADSTDAMPLLLPPDLADKESLEIQRQCINLYAIGYSLEEIQWMTGLTNLRMMRKWLREAGVMGGTTGIGYPPETKADCLRLYKEGLTPRQIETKTRVPADVIIHWLSYAGLSRPKRHFTDADRQRCLELYLQGHSCKTVEEQTGVPDYMVKKWIKLDGVKRERIFGGGRSDGYPLEFRQECLDLLQQGKTPSQVEKIMGVSADTIRKWKKQSDPYQNS